MAKLRWPIPPRNAGVGACDQVKIMQSNAMLRMVLLQKKLNSQINVKMCPLAKSGRVLWFELAYVG